ncbi:Acb2/Tad1 domain-containing protein [Brucella pseudogrignonensis]|uniref:Acb2/Tad1 domain-containing protein n=1 Tax=Brucella pseudogrignonensis TaxID=419475 RepID=UPI003D968820
MSDLRDELIETVAAIKAAEKLLLLGIDAFQQTNAFDKRWLSIARTNIEQGFMALNRSILCPEVQAMARDDC